MKEALLILTLVFTAQVAMVSCGHVYSWDVDFEYQNAGHAYKFNLYFALESGLSADDYINVKFPFILGNPGFSAAPRGSLYQVTDGVQIGTTLPAQGPNDNTNYFWSFGVALLKDTWYRLSVAAVSINSIGNQVEGRQPLIEFRTSSGIYSNNIVYDLNPTFATFSLAPSPPLNLALQINFVSLTNDRFYLENTYQAAIDVTPSVFVREGAFFDLILTNPDYTFTGICDNGDFVCPADAISCANIQRLPSSSCSVDTKDPRKIRFLYDADVQNGKKFRIIVNFKNPSKLSIPSDIIVLSVSRRSNLIYEKGTLFEPIRCGQISLAAPIIKYLWGITQKTLEPCPIGPYAPIAGYSSIDYPWNNIRVHFKFLGKTSSTLSHRVVVKFNGVFSVLEGSVLHNLPNFGSKEVQCTYSSNVLTCENVGNLQESSSSYNYFVGLRLQLQALPSAFVATSFGTVQIFTIDSQGVSNPLSGEVRPLSQTRLASSDYSDAGANGYQGSSNTIGFQYVVSTDSTAALDYAFTTTLLSTTGRGGIKLSSSTTGQTLVFLIQPSSTDICSGTCTHGSNRGQNVLMKIVFNNANIGISSTDLASGIKIYGAWMGTSPSTSCISGRCLNYATQNDANKWNKINSVAAAQDDAAYEHLSLTCISQGASESICYNVVKRDGTSAFSLLALPGAKFGTNYKGVGFYPDQSVIDFLICFKNAASGVDPTSESGYSIFVSAKLINTFVINSVPANLKAAFINYYHFSGSGANYAYAPTILRLTGTLSASDLTSGGAALSVLFDKNIMVSQLRRSATDRTVGCGSSTDASLTCKSYSASDDPSKYVAGLLPYAPSRVDVIRPVASAAAMNIYIPVYYNNVAGINNNWDLGIIVSSAMSGDTRFYSTIGTYRIWGPVFDTNTLYSSLMEINLQSRVIFDSTTEKTWMAHAGNSGSNCDGLSFGLSDPQSVLIPGLKSTNIKFQSTVTTGACLGTYNSGNLNGGAFVMTSTLNIWGSSAITWGMAGTANGNTCVRLTYYASYTPKYVVVCPSDNVAGNSQAPGASGQGVTFADITSPIYWGTAFDNQKNIYYSWSRPNSLMAAYSFEKGSVTQPLECTNYVWPNFVTNAASQYITVQFKFSGDYSLKAGDVLILENWYTARPDNLFTLSTKPCSVRGDLSNFNLSSCTVAQFDSQKLTFTLTVRDTTTTKGDVFISFFVEHTSATPSSQYFHGFKVLIYEASNVAWYAASTFNVIEDCYSKSTSRRSIPRSIENTLSGKLNISQPIFINTKSARSAIRLKFGINDKRTVWDDSVIGFDLGYLNTPNNKLLGDIRCYVLDEAGKFSFEWLAIDVADPRNILLYPKRIMNNPKNYLFECLGGKTLDGLSKLNLSAYFRSGKDVLQRSDQLIAPVPQPENLIPESNVKIVKKTLNNPGFEATYSISFTPSRKDIDILGCIYVRWFTGISPRLNGLGDISCFLDGRKTECFIIEEKTIRVQILRNLTANSTTPCLLEIRKVTQPNYIASNQKVWFALDDDLNMWNGVSEQIEIKEIAMNLLPIQAFYINKISRSNLNTRDNYNISFNVTVPAKTFTLNNRLFIRFPLSTIDLLRLQNDISGCTILRLGAPNLALNYSFTPDQRFLIYLLNDTLNLNQPVSYTVYLNLIRSPDYVPLNRPSLFQIYTVSADESEIVSLSEFGYLDEAPVTWVDNPNNNYMNWFVKTVEGLYIPAPELITITRGTYKQSLYLGFTTVSGQLYNTSFDYRVSNRGASPLSLWPETARAEVGYQFSTVLLGSEAPAGREVYYAGFDKVNGDSNKWMTTVPALKYVISNEKCSINAMLASYNLPEKGTTLPIFFDFADCMPFRSIQIFANFSSNSSIERNLTFMGNQNATQTITFDNTTGNTQGTKVFFQISSLTSINLVAGQIHTIQFFLQGPSADSYMTPNPVNILIINSSVSLGAPNATVPVVNYDSVKRKTIIDLKCDAPSQLYYIFSLDRNVSQTVSYVTIRNQTQFRNRMITERDVNDQQWTVMGFAMQETLLTTPKIYLDGLRSNGSYYFRYYCIDLMGLVSQPSEMNWTQADNQGRFSRMILNYTAELSISQYLNTVCALLKIFSLRKEQVVTATGASCPSTASRILQSNASNSSNSSSNTTNNQSSSNTQQNTTGTGATNTSEPVLLNYSYSVFFLPDLAASQENLQDIIQRRLNANLTQFIIDLGVITPLSPSIRGISFAIVDLFENTTSRKAPYIDSGASLSNIGSDYVSVQLTIENSSGFALAGVSFRQYAAPDIYSLRAGQTGIAGLALRGFNYVYAQENQKITLNVTGLSPKTDYTLYYGAVNDNPTRAALGSQVGSMNFTTNSVGSSAFRVGCLVLLSLLLAFVFSF